MENLRMLHFESEDIWRGSNVVIASSLESLPDGLKIIHWDGFPQRSLPPNDWPQNLVRLEMRDCNLEQLWEPDQQGFPKLKRLDLSYSRKLSRIPDLYLSPDIEEILLICCESLTEVYSSGFLNKLNCLCLYRCAELRSLTIPTNILWRSTGSIILCNCSKLETISINNSEVVQLSGCSHHDTFPTGWYCQEYRRISGLSYHIMLAEGSPPTLSSPNKLCFLDLSWCKSLTSFPIGFDLSKLKFLKTLLLNGCSNFEEFPEIKDTMENLAVLKLDRTAIKILPSSLCRLVALEELSLDSCASLETIPSSIGDLSKLYTLDLIYCRSLETFPSSIFKLKLTKLDLSGCSKLRTFPEILEPAQTFAQVNLTRTAIKELPLSFGNLVQLQTLRLNMCTDLESLPNSIVNLKLLSVLDCSRCAKLTKIPSDIGRLSLLRELSLSESGIVNLPESIAHLSSLELLDLSECKKLERIPRLPAFDRQSIRRVMSNSLIQIPKRVVSPDFISPMVNNLIQALALILWKRQGLG
ncbi:hypothetical protein JHK86_000312 [Glycine max]|nr:hypothetical protein JHK86_000312 [Glycine max]